MGPSLWDQTRPICAPLRGGKSSDSTTLDNLPLRV
uniref:Uncharacterized protein n=1 Tax=Peronospora matthiolae TaxID=2874970 RepID=A0AAV1THE2_9STRA